MAKDTTQVALKVAQTAGMVVNAYDLRLERWVQTGGLNTEVILHTVSVKPALAAGDPASKRNK